MFGLLMDLHRFFSSSPPSVPPSAPPPTHHRASSPGQEGKEGKGLSPLQEEVQRRLSLCLIRGLSDPDDRGLEAGEEEGTEVAREGGKEEGVVPAQKGIRRRLIAFWGSLSSAPSSLPPTSPVTKLQFLLRNLHHPSNPSAFLPTTTYLLLSLSLASPAASSLLFPQPLANVKFTDLPLSFRPSLPFSLPSSLPSAISTMSPLFSFRRTSALLSQATQREGRGRGTERGKTASGGVTGWIRATQGDSQGAWALTQEGGEERAGNRGGGRGGSGRGRERGHQFTTVSGVASQAGSKESALMVRKAGVTGGERVGGKEGGTQEGRGLMPPPPPRKSKGLTWEDKMRAGLEGGEEGGRGDGAREEEEEEEGKEGGRPVVLYRRYREGELPDIQIPASDIIRPLQLLCLRDAAMARTLFAALFPPLYAQASGGGWEGGRKGRGGGKAAMVQAMKRALEGSMRETDLVAGVLAAYRAAMDMEGREGGDERGEGMEVEAEEGVEEKEDRKKDGEGVLPVHLTAESGLQSLNFQAAILVLEEEVVRREGMERVAGRGRRGEGEMTGTGRKKEGSSSTLEIWVELMRLYRALGEGDVVRGLVERVVEEEGEKEGGKEGGEKSAMTRTRLAVASESEGHWEKALEQYAKLLELSEKPEGGKEGGGQDKEVVALWHSRRRECLRRLGEWTQLQDEIEAAVQPAKQHSSGAGYSIEAMSINGIYDKLWSLEEVWQGGREGGGAGGGDVLAMWIESLVHRFSAACLGQEEQEKARGGTSSALNLQEALLLVADDADAARRQWLASAHPSLLASLHFFLRDQVHAQAYVEQAYRTFMRSWKGLHPLAGAARRAQLEGLEYLVEMEDALRISRTLPPSLSSFPSSSLTRSLSSWEGKRLLRGWQLAPAPVMEKDPPLVWADIGMLREWSLSIPRERDGHAPSQNVDEEQDMRDFRRERYWHHLSFWQRAARAAVKEWGEGGVAMKCWEKAKVAFRNWKVLVDAEEEEDGERIETLVGAMLSNVWAAQIRLFVELDKWKLRQAVDEGGRGGAAVVERVLWGRAAKAIRQRLVSLEGRESGSQSRRAWMEVMQLKAEWFEMASGFVTKRIKWEVGQERERDAFLCSIAKSYWKVWRGQETQDEIAGFNVASLRQDWLHETYQAYRAVMTEEKEGRRRWGRGTRTVARRAAKFARFCDRLVRERREDMAQEGKQGGESEHLFSPAALTAQAMARYLEALTWCPAEAPAALPRLVDMIRESHDPYEPQTNARVAREVLQKCAGSVPAWIFLPAASQLLAGLDAPEAEAVLPVLLRLAQAYPQALFYPYRVAKPGFSSMAYAQELDRLLQLPALERFVENVAMLVSFPVAWRAILGRIRSLLQVGDVPQEEVQHVYAAWRETLTESPAEDRGLYTCGWMKNEVAKRLDPKLGRRGEHLNRQTLKEVASDLALNVQGTPKHTQERIERYSLWLARYRMECGDGDHKIEIPGQYDRKYGRWESPPRPDLHVHLVSIDPLVETRTSKQLPRKIVLHADNEKSYPFLVKGGEDCRNDERIERLFESMNGLMAADTACAQNGLECQTYKIIPLSPSLGLIEWCSNTIVLRLAIEKGSRRRGAQLAVSEHDHRGKRGHPPRTSERFKEEKEDSFEVLAQDYAQLYPSVMDYHTGYRTLSPSKAGEKLAAFHARVPWNGLRQYLLLLAPSPEVFLTLRSTFAKSLAAFSICSYVVGVGDRHLENFLLDTRSACVVGIDFGVAFGIGASALPVPELIPFRLTRQMLNVLRPLDSEVGRGQVCDSGGKRALSCPLRPQ